MNEEIKRRFPKVLADELSQTLSHANDLMGNRIIEILDIYRRRRTAFIAFNGLTLDKERHDVKPINYSGIPFEWFDAILDLDLAFNKAHDYLGGGAKDYLSKSVKIEAFRLSGGRHKGAQSCSNKFLMGLISRNPNKSSNELYQACCEEARLKQNGSPFGFDHAGEGTLIENDIDISKENFSKRISKVRNRHLR